jgi:excisionase family DNA binding protein
VGIRKAKLLTIYEVAADLGIREGTIRLWLKQGRLPRVNCGRCVRIPAEALEEFVRKHTVPAKIGSSCT